LLLILGIAAIGAAVPRVLIFQTSVAFRGTDNPNLPLSNRLAAEFDELGKLEAVVWSLTDPIFRAAATAGKVTYKESPTLADVLAAGKGVDADYVLVSQAFKDSASYKGKIELFKGGKSVWKDEQNMAVRITTESDAESSLLSLARTLVLRMNAEALKGLPSHKTAATPALIKGQAPVQVNVTPVEPPKKDNSPILKNAQSLFGSGRPAAAISSLRDAVDSDPLDAELRIALVNLLLSVDPAAAAQEARNAAEIMPEAVDLRVLAARAWMLSGKPEEAQSDLNEAMARNPDGPGTRLLLGEIAIAQLKPERGVDHLTKSIEAADSAEARFLRAFCYALAGSSEAMRGDLDQFAKLEPSPTPADVQRRYAYAAEILDRSIQLDANSVRALIQRAIVKPNDKEVLAAVEHARKQIRARGGMGERLTVPPAFKAANEKRMLAYKLMAQSLSDLLGYMAGGGDESLTDARINLGEAIRNASDGRAAEMKARQG
jgi:tetratricopeptide (TPR) repeat protein